MVCSREEAFALGASRAKTHSQHSDNEDESSTASIENEALPVVVCKPCALLDNFAATLCSVDTICGACEIETEPNDRQFPAYIVALTWQ